MFSFPFSLELFLCIGLKYFDFSLKLLQILLLNEQVLRRLTSFRNALLFRKKDNMMMIVKQYSFLFLFVDVIQFRAFICR